MQPTQGAACVVGTTTSTSVWYVSNVYMDGIAVASAVVDDVEQGACADPTAWTREMLEIDGWSKSSLATGAGMGLTVATNPVLVWNNGNNLLDTRHGIWAAEYGAGSQPDRWASPVRLLTKDEGNPDINVGSDGISVAATAWGGDSLLVVCPVAYSSAVFIGTYVLGQRDTADGTWVAAYQTTITAAQIGTSASDVKDTGFTVSCDWFPVGETDANGPVGYLAVGLNPLDGKGPVVGYLKLLLDDDGVPYVDSTTSVWDRLAGEGPAAVVRDPAGRLRAYAVQDSELVTLTFATASAPTAGGSNGYALPLVRRDTRPAPNGKGLPAAAFATMSSQQAAVPTVATVVQSSGAVSQGPIMANQTPAYEFVFYEDQPSVEAPDLAQANVYAQLGSFGWAQEFLSTGTPSRSATTAEPGAVIRGIIDGPIPIPLGNATGTAELAELNYSATKLQTVDHRSEFSWTAGVKSTGEPSSGLGLVWDISVAAGTGTTSGSTTSSGFTTSASQPTSTSTTDTGQTVMQQAGWVWAGQSALTFAAYRWVESVGATTDDRPALQRCGDGTYRVYARHGTQLFFYLGVPAGGGAIQWAADDVAWENDPKGPGSVDGVPAVGLDPSSSGGTGHVWTRDGFGSTVRFTQTPQGWTGLFDVAGVGIGSFGGDPVPFLVGDVEHVLVVSTTGELWDVHPGGSQGGWGADNLSATQKNPMLCRTSPMAHPAVSAGDNGNGTWTVSVLFPSQQGHLFMLYNPSYPSASGWTYDDLSYEVHAEAGGWVTIDADVVRSGGVIMSTGSMGSGTDGHLQQWSWHPAQGATPAGWTCTDVSTLVGNTAGEPWPQLLGTCAILSSDPLAQAGLSVLGRRVDGHLLLMTQSGTGPWTHLDLTVHATGGVACAGDPVAVDDCTAMVVATDGHLMLVERPSPASAAWSMTDVTVAAGLGGSAPAVISDSTSGVEGQTPQWINLSSTYTGDAPSSYPLFGPVAGDLLSYTAHSWNTRMAALAAGWNGSAPVDQSLYDGTDYISDVVLQYAQPFTDGTKTVSALWSGGPTVAQAYNAVQSDFVENSWTLDASFYAGLGWGGLPAGEEAVGIFGNEAWSVMVGGSVHVSRTSTVTDQSAWGISVSGPTSASRWGPPQLNGPAGPGVVAEYAFDVYLLPPPSDVAGPKAEGLPANYWTTELRAGLASLPSGAAWPGVGYVRPETIDPGSGAWKVMFVLTAYTAGPTLTLDPETPAAGQAVALSGSFYGLDCSPVDITITGGTLAGGVSLGSGALDPNGRFGEGGEEPAITVTLPATLGPGTYTVTATTPTGPASGTSTFTLATPPAGS